MIMVTLKIVMVYALTDLYIYTIQQMFKQPVWIQRMLHPLMDLRGEFLENFGYIDRGQKINTSTKEVYVTQLSDALVIQLKHFQYQ